MKSELLASSGSTANDAEAVARHIETLDEPPALVLLPGTACHLLLAFVPSLRPCRRPFAAATAGESLLFQAPKVVLLGSHVTTVCTLAVTNHRLSLRVWRPKLTSPQLNGTAETGWGELSVGNDDGIMDVPLMSIARVQAVADMAGAKGKTAVGVVPQPRRVGV